MFNTKIFEGGNGSASPSINIPNGLQQLQQQPQQQVQQGGNNFGENLNIPQPIDITYQRQPSVFNNSRLRRESIAHSQGMGGVSWGSVTIGSWLKDEVMMFANSHGQNLQQNMLPAQQSHAQVQSQHQHQPSQHQQLSQQMHLLSHGLGDISLNPRRSSFRYNPSISMAQSPPTTSYLPDLEADYCKDYSCCGQLLPTLHDLLRHYEEAHISQSPPIDNPLLQQNRSRQNNNTMHNIMETVSTNDVFLNNGSQHQLQQQQQAAQQAAQQQQQQQAAQQAAQQQQQQAAQQQHHIQQQQQNQQHQANQNNNYTMQNQIPTYQQNLQHLSQLSQPQQHNQLSQQQHHNIQQQNSGVGQGQGGSGAPASLPGTPDDEDSMYIDDPARHLYVMEHQEHKPFKCPVIGCEKNYKNQNGLKYHRLHGHQNQTLKENPDGTISIIDPESNAPYLDGAGMEKDKPYRCEVCGKRYKNLNGLKYHRGHTTH